VTISLLLKPLQLACPISQHLKKSVAYFWLTRFFGWLQLSNFVAG